MPPVAGQWHPVLARKRWSVRLRQLQGPPPPSSALGPSIRPHQINDTLQPCVIVGIWARKAVGTQTVPTHAQGRNHQPTVGRDGRHTCDPGPGLSLGTSDVQVGASLLLRRLDRRPNPAGVLGLKGSPFRTQRNLPSLAGLVVANRIGGLFTRTFCHLRHRTSIGHQTHTFLTLHSHLRCALIDTSGSVQLVRLAGTGGSHVVRRQ